MIIDLCVCVVKQVTIFDFGSGCVTFGFVDIFFLRWKSLLTLLTGRKKENLVLSAQGQILADDQTKRKYFRIFCGCVCVCFFGKSNRCDWDVSRDGSDSHNPISIVLNNNFLCIDNMIRYDWGDRYRTYTCLNMSSLLLCNSKMSLLLFVDCYRYNFVDFFCVVRAESECARKCIAIHISTFAICKLHKDTLASLDGKLKSCATPHENALNTIARLQIHSLSLSPSSFSSFSWQCDFLR